MLTILTGQPSKYKEILKDPNLVLDNAISSKKKIRKDTNAK